MFLCWGPQSWHSTPSENHLPWPAAQTGFASAQDSVGFLGCQSTLPGHAGLLISQDLQSLLLRAAISLFSTQPIFVLRIALTQGQDFALGLAELHELHRSHISSLSWSLLTSPHSWVTSADLLRVHLIPVHVTNKDVKQPWSLYWPQGMSPFSSWTSSHWLGMSLQPPSQIFIYRVIHPQIHVLTV